MAGKDAKATLRIKAIDSMSKVIDRIKGKIPKLTNAVKNANKKFATMRMRTESLRKSLGKMGRTMKNIGKGMSIGLTAPIVAFGILSIATAAKFEKSMNKVAALTGATGKSLESMTKLAKKLGSETKFSATQAADAMAFLGQAGFKTNDILSATPAILDLAAASSTDLATAADIASNVMGAFNIKAKDASRVTDVLALATAKGNTNMLQLAEAMKDAGPVAQKAGISIEETSALIAKLGDAGIQGSKAGTTLKNMFLNLAAPTSRIKKIMSALGVKTIDPVTKQMRSMTAILADMSEAFDKKGIKGAKKLAILNEIFGKRAIAGAGVLLDQAGKLGTDGVNSIARLTAELENSGGAAKRMAKTMEKGLPGAITSFKSAFEGLQIAILDVEFGGVKLKVIIEKLINRVTKFIRGLSTTNTTMLKWGIIIAGVVAALGPLVFAFGVFLTVLPSMITGFALLKSGLLAIKLATMGALVPMLPFIAALGLVAAAAFLIHKNWKPIKEFFSDLFTSPIQQLKDMLGFLGKITGISKLFGFGDDTDEKLKKQGFQIGKPQGEAVGTRGIVKESKDKQVRERKAMLDVNFSNMPKGTRVMADDRDGILDSLTGNMGII